MNTKSYTPWLLTYFKPYLCLRHILPAAAFELVEVFNHRLQFYPIFHDDEFNFGELQVLAVAQRYADSLDHIHVYDDGIERTTKINLTTGDYAKDHIKSLDQRMSPIEVIDYIAGHDSRKAAQTKKQAKEAQKWILSNSELLLYISSIQPCPKMNGALLYSKNYPLISQGIAITRPWNTYTMCKKSGETTLFHKIHAGPEGDGTVFLGCAGGRVALPD